MIDDYSSLPSFSQMTSHVSIYLSPFLVLYFFSSLFLSLSLELPSLQMLPDARNILWSVSVGHTVSRWLPTITNYNLIAGLCLQLVIPLPLYYYAHDQGWKKLHWMWLRCSERGMITANACDAMCWSIKCSSFSSSVWKRVERGKEREREPKKYSCFKYSCQSLLLLSTKWWMTLSDLKRTCIKTSTSNWTLTVTDPSFSLSLSFPFLLFFIPSMHPNVFSFSPFVPSFPSFQVCAIQFPFFVRIRWRSVRMSCEHVLVSLSWCEMHGDEKKSSEMNNESTALMTAQHVFVFSGAFHFDLKTFFFTNYYYTHCGIWPFENQRV